MDYSDEGTPKGFDIWDTESDEIEFVENTISPRFVRYKLSDFVKRKDTDELKKEINNSYFKLIVDMNVPLQELNDLLSGIQAIGALSVASEWENG